MNRSSWCFLSILEIWEMLLFVGALGHLCCGRGKGDLTKNPARRNKAQNGEMLNWPTDKLSFSLSHSNCRVSICSVKQAPKRLLEGPSKTRENILKQAAKRRWFPCQAGHERRATASLPSVSCRLRGHTELWQSLCLGHLMSQYSRSWEKPHKPQKKQHNQGPYGFRFAHSALLSFSRHSGCLWR